MPTHKSVVLEHRGGMRFVGDPSSGHEIAFDDRASNTGGSPVETILSALGACTGMDVISIARKKRLAIDEYRVHVHGSQRDEYPQVYTEIDVTHEIVGRGLAPAAVARCIELSATKYCPVSAMISAGATVIHHRYRIVSPDDADHAVEGEVVATGPYARPDILSDQT
jgi:putative redox protein